MGRFFFPLLILCCFFASVAFASPATQGASVKKAPVTFYEDNKRGWFWYEEPPPPIEEEEEKEDPPPVATQPPAPQEQKQTSKDFTYQELWTMYPPQFQKVYDNTLHQAMMTNSIEDVRDFALMQDVARRRATALAEVFSYVTNTTPQFNTVKDFPMATPGRRAMLGNRFDALETEMKSAQKDHALLYFHSPSCSYCVEQSKILNLFYRDTQWEIEPINVDDNPMLAQEFNVTTVPSLFLINRNSPTPYPVAFGITPLDELQRNIYQGIRVLARGPVGLSVYDYESGSALDPRAIKEKSDIDTYGGVPQW